MHGKSAVRPPAGSVNAFLSEQLIDSVEHHVRGTDFGIGVDASDGLLRQGAPGYQLTWMDAKVDSWVVTPRRGKAVEINALWYNALRLLEGWLREEGDERAAQSLNKNAQRAGESAAIASSLSQRMAVLIPINSPLVSTSAPPEFPGLMAASV